MLTCALLLAASAPSTDAAINVGTTLEAADSVDALAVDPTTPHSLDGGTLAGAFHTRTARFGVAAGYRGVRGAGVGFPA